MWLLKPNGAWASAEGAPGSSSQGSRGALGGDAASQSHQEAQMHGRRGGRQGGGVQGGLLTFRPPPRQPACSVPQLPHPQAPRGVRVQKREHPLYRDVRPCCLALPTCHSHPQTGRSLYICAFVNQYQRGALEMTGMRPVAQRTAPELQRPRGSSGGSHPRAGLEGRGRGCHQENEHKDSKRHCCVTAFISNSKTRDRGVSASFYIPSARDLAAHTVHSTLHVSHRLRSDRD